MPIHIQNASVSQFNQIKHYITQFELDNRELQQQQFLVATCHHEVLGFGRIRNYAGCDELCSLGVIQPERLKGIGTQLVQELIKKAGYPLFLVCIIPDFFEALGFKTTNEYPAQIADKLYYCKSELVVPEDYVVMKYEENSLSNF